MFRNKEPGSIKAVRKSFGEVLARAMFLAKIYGTADAAFVVLIYN